MLRKFAIAALLLALIAAPVCAEEPTPPKPLIKTPQSISSPEVNAAMNAIYKARNDDDRKAAIDSVQKLVDAGNMQAAFRLGRYLHLETRRTDYARAMQLYQLAASKGDAWAINNIGVLYEDGQGVSQDFDKAITLFKQAAEKQHFHGFTNLARLSMLGRGVPHDPAKADEWLTKGCDLKLLEVCREGFDVYEYGRYTAPVDKAKSFGFAVKAAALGDPDYQYNLALHYRRGEGTPVDLKKSVELLIPLAAKNHVQAMSALGSAYIEGLGTEQDKAKGMALLETSAARGYCTSSVKLGHIYRSDADKAANAKAVHYIEQAYENCDDDEQLTADDLSFAGHNYQTGLVVPQDCAKALNLYKGAEAIDFWGAAAYSYLANYYFAGCGGFPSDKKLSFKYLLVAAKLGERMSQSTISSLLRHGINGAAPDPIKADAWGLLAVQSPNGDAIPAETIERVLAGKPDDYRKQVMDHLAFIRTLLYQPKQGMDKPQDAEQLLEDARY